MSFERVILCKCGEKNETLECHGKFHQASNKLSSKERKRKGESWHVLMALDGTYADVEKVMLQVFFLVVLAFSYKATTVFPGIKYAEKKFDPGSACLILDPYIISQTADLGWIFCWLCSYLPLKDFPVIFSLYGLDGGLSIPFEVLIVGQTRTAEPEMMQSVQN